MQINPFPSPLVTVDEVSSYIPFASTVTNLVDLFQKYVVFPLLNKEIIVKSHYYRYLDQKSAIRCVILLVPFVGNIVIGVYDFFNIKEGKRLFDLALCYEEGKGVPQIAIEAVKLYQQAAIKGHADAMNNLADFYAEGLGGLQRDLVKARELYQQAADKGHAAAMNNLAIFYKNGHGGLKKDKVIARMLYQRAAKKGDPDAITNLADFYAEGLGDLEQDLVKARELYRLAAEKGHEDAEHRLKLLLGPVG